MTQQIHSFRASGVRSLQAACAVAAELRALRRSAGTVCSGPGLVSLLTIMLSATPRKPRFRAAVSEDETSSGFRRHRSDLAAWLLAVRLYDNLAESSVV